MTWHGPQPKGAARTRRAERREDAEHRNAETPHNRTKAHRLGKCDCTEGDSK